MTTQSASFPQVHIRGPRLLMGALAWLPVPILLYGLVLRTYAEVLGALVLYLVLGLVVGALRGGAYALAWPGPLGWRWVRAGVAGYGLALPIGLLLSTLIPTIMWFVNGDGVGFMPLAVPGNITFWPFVSSVVLGGFLPGAWQWPVLRARLPAPRAAMGLLWVCGVWLGICLGQVFGMVAMNVVRAPGPPGLMGLLLHGLVMGVTAMLVEMGVLALLRRETA